tara:strand:+ start:8320 stop:8484 length:165 start_codon:yes stop_codon:yes gene_type:complete
MAAIARIVGGEQMRRGRPWALRSVGRFRYQRQAVKTGKEDATTALGGWRGCVDG